MFLKSLSMKGFKSFADSTVLEFEPGITVVVGPNGSGKSNVVDAVTWVLGAQGPRSLRSQKMEDVIFAGTMSRPALGRAEVSLTIDNSSGKLPVDMAEVTITRTLFRSGDSEYAINGAPCRLMDIQDLLSDSGVGRTQHMIIGQGQLDTVLNARPEDRRAIIEEAAGVLKHRRRRERAERRLLSTQENLERLGDLLREVRRQIRPLERQAAAARSHAAVADELLAVRTYLAGAELTDLTSRRTAAASGLVESSDAERELRQALEALDAEAASTAAEMSAHRQEDLAEGLGRVQGLVERTRGMSGVLRERQRSLVLALDAAADVDVVSTLEAEGARLGSELASSSDEAASLEPELAALSEREHEIESQDRALLAARRVAEAEFGGQGPDEALDLARNRLELLTRAAGRAGEVLSAFDDRITGLVRRAETASSTASSLDERAAVMAADGERLSSAAHGAEAAAREAAARLIEAQQASDEAERARHRSAARAEALERALHELQGGGAELLADVDGVVGSLLDLVEIDAGWEAAFEAAAGAAVAAVVVDGRRAARQALEQLRRSGATGAVLAADDALRAPAGSGSGSAWVPDRSEVPAGCELVRDHVRGRRHGLDGVLDALVGGAVRTDGWEQAIDVALDRPDLVVVTAEGDRFARSGWRVRSTRGVVTAAAVEEAEQAAVQTAQLADRVASALAEARAAFESSRAAADDAARDVYRHEADRSSVVSERDRLVADAAAAEAEVLEARTAREAAEERLTADRRELDALAASLPDIERRAEEATVRAAADAEARRALDERRAELGSARRALEVRTAGVAERRKVLETRLAEVERRLEGHAEEREEAAARRRKLEADGRALSRLSALVVAEGERLTGILETLQGEYREQLEAVRAGGERLETLRQDRTALDRRLTEVRERIRTLELESAEVGVRAEALEELISRELHLRPEDVVGAECPELPEGVSARELADKLEERLAKLGPVNPWALEELSTLEERRTELETQVDDVRHARRELQEVVRTLNEEIMTLFASAAADVNEHFSELAAMLFPGGTGRMVLTEPENLLETGVEVEVRPMGRNVRRVSLLSGGERSLAALAFLFAVFRSRPSPFYLMDEVEAALDDVNLNRFLGLVRQFRDEAQLIIVSHQKRTMETGDALYGVTMAPGGSSQVVSQKVASHPEPPSLEAVAS
jgi:chromosome segregation protein